MSWTPPGHCVSISRPMFSAPRYQPVNGGISQTASRGEHRRRSRRCPCPRTPRRSGRAAPAAPASGSARRCPRSGCASASWAWARWRALLTAAVVVSSASATSAAFQRSTSRRISTARCRAGRCCRAATNASRIDVPLGDHGTARRPGDRLAARRSRGSPRAASPASASRGAEAGGQRPARPALEGGQADVGGDPVEPGAHRGAALEVVGRPARRAGRSPGPGPRPRAPTRSSGSSARAARAGSARSGSGKSSSSVGSRCSSWSLSLLPVVTVRLLPRQSACHVPTGVDGGTHRSPARRLATGRRGGDRRRAPRAQRALGGGHGERAVGGDQADPGAPVEQVVDVERRPRG